MPSDQTATPHSGPTAPPASRYDTPWWGGHRAAVAGLFLLCLFLFFWRIGTARLFDLDEALYVTGARNMAVSGDWTTPRLNSRPPADLSALTTPFFEKPALVYWLPALAMRVFGPSEWAARLPSALAALLLVGATVWVGARWFGPRAGLLAGLTLATCPLTLLNARQMTTDGLLVLWLALALFAFYEVDSARRAGFSIGWRTPLLFWVACALAVLTKGAVGLLLPGLVVGACYVTERFRVRFRWHSFRNWLVRVRPHSAPPWLNGLRALRPLTGLLLVLLLAAPWHLAVSRTGERDAQGRTWAQEYLGRQHIGRFRGGDTVHNAPLPTYVAYFLLGFFPWACFVPAALRGAGFSTQSWRFQNSRQRHTLHSNETSDSPPTLEEGQTSGHEAVPVAARHATPESFLKTWFWTIFVFFSIGAAKLPTYIAPIYPAAALLIGRWLDRILAERGLSPALRPLCRGALAACATAGLLLLAAVVGPRFAPANAPVPAAVVRLAWMLTGSLCLGSIAAFGCFLWGKRAQGVAALALSIVLLVGIGTSQGYVVANRYVLAPYQSLAESARPYAERGVQVVYYHIVPRRPSMLFYAGYSPLERKETPLLPYLRETAPREAIVITSQRTYREHLRPELDAAGVSAETLAETGEGAEGWRMLRIAVVGRKTR